MEHYEFWFNPSNYSHDQLAIANNTYSFELDILESKKGEEGIFLGMTSRQLKIFAFFQDKKFSSIFTLQSKVYKYLKNAKFGKIEHDSEYFRNNTDFKKIGYNIFADNITCHKGCYGKAQVYKVNSGNLSFPEPFPCDFQDYCSSRYDVSYWKNVKLNIQSFPSSTHQSKDFINTAQWCDKCDHIYSILSECNCDKFNNSLHSDITFKMLNYHHWYPTLFILCLSHRHILVKNSEYFETAFSGKFKSEQMDERTNIYTVTEFPSKFLHLLYYIYNCRFQDEIQQKFNDEENFRNDIIDCALFYGITIRIILQNRLGKYHHILQKPVKEKLGIEPDNPVILADNPNPIGT